MGKCGIAQFPTDFVSAIKRGFQCYQNWKTSNCVIPVSLMRLPVWVKTTTWNCISNSQMLNLLNTTPKGSCLGRLKLRILLQGPEFGAAVYYIRSHMSGQFRKDASQHTQASIPYLQSKKHPFRMPLQYEPLRLLNSYGYQNEENTRGEGQNSICFEKQCLLSINICL